MKKYRLKKDTPQALKGTIVESDYFSQVETILNFDEWFEEVDGRWKPKEGDFYYYIYPGDKESGFGIVQTCWMGEEWDDIRYHFGNIFKAKEDAEKVRDQLLELLLKTQKELHG